MKSDVAPQIVNGRTLVPIRAVAEAIGKWVEWDEEQRLVLISEKPAAHAHHEKYAHPADLPAPTVELKVTPDAKSGFNLHIVTTNWNWTPEKVDTEAVPNEGHAHLYVDGVKVGRLYGPWFHLSSLTPGQHDIKVTLNANNHADYLVDGHVLAASASVVIKADGSRVVEGGEAMEAHDHGHQEGHDHGHDEGHDKGHDH